MNKNPLNKYQKAKKVESIARFGQALVILALLFYVSLVMKVNDIYFFLLLLLLAGLSLSIEVVGMNLKDEAIKDIQDNLGKKE